MTNGGFRQVALSGARWTAAAKVGLLLFTWPVTIVVIRLLEPGDYGLMAMAMVTIGFVTLFSEMGLGTALIQVNTLDDAMARAACAAILACNIVIAAALASFAPLAASWFEEPDLTAVMRWLTLELVVSALSAVPQAQLERQLRFKQLSIASVAAGVGGSIATLILAVLDFGVWALVFGNLVMACIRTTLLIFYNGRMVWPSFHQWLRPIRGLVGFSSHVLAARALWYWYGQSDQIIVARLLHASLLGHYNVAAQLAMLPAHKAMEVFNRVSLPILSRMQTEQGGLQDTHHRLVGLVAIYAFGTCWGLAAVAPEFVATVLGEKWQPAATPLMLLAAVAPLRMLSALNNTFTTAAGVPQASTSELAFAGILMPTAVLLGVWLDGLHGACLAWVFAYPVVYMTSNALTCTAVGSAKWSGMKPLSAPVIAAGAMWLCIWAIRWCFSDAVSAGWLLMVELVAGAVSYLVFSHMLAPTLAREARALTIDLLRPKTASTGVEIGPG